MLTEKKISLDIFDQTVNQKYGINSIKFLVFFSKNVRTPQSLFLIAHFLC